VVIFQEWLIRGVGICAGSGCVTALCVLYRGSGVVKWENV